MSKTTITSISLPSGIVKEIEGIAKKEHKTKSGVVQDAVKQFLELRKWQSIQAEATARARGLRLYTDDDIEKLVDEVRR